MPDQGRCCNRVARKLQLLHVLHCCDATSTQLAAATTATSAPAACRKGIQAKDNTKLWEVRSQLQCIALTVVQGHDNLYNFIMTWLL